MKDERLKGTLKGQKEHNGTYTVTRILVGFVLLAIVIVAMPSLVGPTGGEEADAGAVFRGFFSIIGTIAGLGLAANLLVDRKEWDSVKSKQAALKQIVSKYNQQVKGLQNQYNRERKQSSLAKAALRSSYSSRYDTLRNTYLKERRSYLASWRRTHRSQRLFRTFWGWVLVLGLCGAVYSCSYSMGSYEEVETTGTATAWNADNIPMPHLTDGTRYVSNPDNVLSANTVMQVDQTLKRLDDSLNIESAVIIVNHIENDDPFRMAQDVGNKYGVGRDDRGLVIVIGYEDHSINISPGRSLETYLTDAECYRLEQRYVIPAMRAEQPDSAMIYLTEGLYSLMQGKDLPEMPELSAPASGDDIIGLYLVFFMLWFVFAAIMESRHEWLGAYALMTLASNPFVETASSFSSGGGFSGGRGGGSFGGGGFSGGFGGGSFGGGGATARW